MIDDRKQQRWRQTIGAQVRSRRKHLGLSLKDLSRLSGANVPTLSHIERGNRDVKLSTLVNLAEALRADLSSLFETDVESGEAVSVSGPESPHGYDLDDD